MGNKPGILGKKLGMTQVFTEEGQRVAVTAIQAGPCVVVNKRTPDRDGYAAVQLGFGDKPARLATRPESGYFKRQGVTPQRFVREIRVEPEELERFEVGKPVRPSDLFAAGALIDVTGISKGKGFMGVMRRYHFSGFRNTHGTHEFFRHGGSIGCRLTPGRVHLGKRMGGHLGNVRVTVQNIRIVKILEDDNVILVHGAVPGGQNSMLVIRGAGKAC